MIDSEKQAVQRLDEAKEFNSQGYFQKAFEYAYPAFTWAADGDRPSLFCEAGNTCAYALNKLGRSQEAIEYVQRVLQRCVSRGDQAREAAARLIYSDTLIEIGLDGEGEVESQRALELARKTGQVEVEIRALDIRAIIMMFSEYYELADKILDEAAMLADQHGMDRLYAMIVMHKGLQMARESERFQELGNEPEFEKYLKRAIDLTEQSVKLAHDSGNLRIELVATANLAELYGNSGELDRADELLVRWHDFAEAATQSAWVHYHYTVCDLEKHKGNYEKAIAAGLKAMECAEGIKSADNYVYAIRRIGGAYEAAGDYKAALEMQKKFHVEFKKRVTEKNHWQGKVDELNREMERVQELLLDASTDMARLKEEALTDPLTGLANRRAFDQEMAQLGEDQSTNYTIAVLDLDHFKAVNDAFSHVVGDAVLRDVSQLLAAGCRSTDLICRIGGEEFALILKGSIPSQVVKICERLRQSIEAHDWAALAHGLEVTASIGVARAEKGQSPAQIFATADNRLFYAKAKGRNRVVTSISALEREEQVLSIVG